MAAGKLAGYLPKAVLVLKLGIFPLPVGRDRGELQATQVPIDLRRHTRVDVLHLGRHVAVDLAVLWICHHWRNGCCEKRILHDCPSCKRRGGGVDDHASRCGVFGLHVVGQKRYFQIAVGRQIKPTTNAGAVIAVDGAAIKHIGHVAVKFACHG